MQDKRRQDDYTITKNKCEDNLYGIRTDLAMGSTVTPSERIAEILGALTLYAQCTLFESFKR